MSNQNVNNKIKQNNIILSAVLAIIIITGGFFLFHNTQTTSNNLATSNMPNVVRNDVKNNPQLAEVSDSSSLLAPRSLSEARSEVGENSPNGLSPLAGDPLVRGGFKVFENV